MFESGTTTTWGSKAILTGSGMSGFRQFELLGQGSRQRVHRLGAQQREKLLIGIEPAQRIDNKRKSGLRQIGFLDQQLLALRLGLIALDQRRGGDLPGVRTAAAGRLLAPLFALQNYPPDCQNLIAWEQLVLISLGERPLNVPIGGAGNLDRDIGRHEAALDGDEEPFLSVFEQIADRGDIIGCEVGLRGDLGVVVPEAIIRFDLRRHNRFSTYLAYRLRGAITAARREHLRSSIFDKAEYFPDKQEAPAEWSEIWPRLAGDF